MASIPRMADLKKTWAGEGLSKLSDLASYAQTQPNYRAAEGTTNRDSQIITWRLPNASAVQMYINPQNLSIHESKQITSTRTKGGYLIQYWGANLIEITLSGITGSAGIQGINVLRDIYLSENRAFDLVAQTQLNQATNAMGSQLLNSGDVGQTINKMTDTIRQNNFVLRPSLASLATSVLMFYQGQEWKGYFTGFQLVEEAERTGMFSYTMNFMATETRGRRENTFAWNREPMDVSPGGALINGLGNSLRSMVGLSAQPAQSFHPENGPMTFGDTSIAADLGFSSTEQQNLLTKGKLF